MEHKKKILYIDIMMITWICCFFYSVEIENLYLLLQTGNPVVLYISRNLISEEDIRKKLKVLNGTEQYILKVVVIENMNTTIPNDVRLPIKRTFDYDTAEYLWSTHYKYKWVLDCVRENPFYTEFFAWIDIHQQILFPKSKRDDFVSYWRWITRSNTLITGRWITFPYSWELVKDKKTLYQEVNWRYCGCFFMGEKNTLIDFCSLYNRCFDEVITKEKMLIWDVNMLSWIELIKPYEFFSLNPRLFNAGHNERTYRFSTDLYAKSLELNFTSFQQTNYTFPTLDGFTPSSSSYIYVPSENLHILNTRYVNYNIVNNYYKFLTPNECVIRTKNIFSILCPDTMKPIYYFIMNENSNTIPIEKPNTISYGFEDIRLFLDTHNELNFIANTIGYNDTGSGISRMCIGSYNIHTGLIENSSAIHSPEDMAEPKYEKNWIPIHRDGDSETYYIYKWFPKLLIGKIVGSRLRLCIEHPSPFMMDVRGSTTFMKTNDGMLGLVHYSEEYNPRHYYHILVLLDETTFEIKKYTEAFYFKRLSIEFCIGMCVIGETKYGFWISQMDRDPTFITVDKDEFRWTKKIDVL